MIHRALAIISMTALLMVGGQSYAAPENGKLESVAMSPRLQTLFAKTKQVCFGRYAMEVPAEANLGSGAQYFRFFTDFRGRPPGSSRRSSGHHGSHRPSV